METSVIRDQASDIAQAFQRLVRLVQEHKGLTTLERDTVINAVRAMDGEVRTLAMLKNAGS